ncbi:MAG: hypothetical protein EOO16_11380 [Chitinophagaceae bacterium]|nr:MAG: hypothetical protein EOO16_11380 [Chitinophagaceae bacterium]
MPSTRSRYPGAKPFALEDKDIFHGRKEDCMRLFELLRTRPLMTLYAASGFGKSSLIQAGLVPLLQESVPAERLLPVTVRFSLPVGDAGEKPPGLLYEKICCELESAAAGLSLRGLPLTAGTEPDSLWSWMKLFEYNGHRVLLVFDQFEEAFSYTDEQLLVFKQQLLCVFAGMPHADNDRLSEQIRAATAGNPTDAELQALDRDVAFLYAPLKTRVLLVIREDYFGYINKLADYFPDVMKDSCKLPPLSRDAARNAIRLPAQAAGDFRTGTFDFTPEALEDVLDRIAGNNKTYDPFTVQLVCRYIEKRIVLDKHKHLIEKGDIPEVGQIVQDFIAACWAALPRAVATTTKQKVARRLIAPDIERRVSVHEGSWIDPGAVEILLRMGMLKRERRQGVDYIELSHDRLVKPILTAYREERAALERARRARRTQLFVVLPLVLLVAALVVFKYRSFRQERQMLVAAQKADDEVQDSFLVKLREQNEEQAVKQLRQRDTLNAINSLKTAAALNLDSDERADTLLDNLFRRKYKKTLYKVDIFYVDREYEDPDQTGAKYQFAYAETIADAIRFTLLSEDNIVVRKRLLHLSHERPGMWEADGNEVRYDGSPGEAEEARRIIAQLAGNFKGNRIELKPRRINNPTPGYISIVLRNKN